jgi:threonyl-tRNA synthetase
MASIRIRLPDNSEKLFDHEPTILEVAESIGSRLAKDTLGGLVNGERETRDLRARLKDGDRLKIVTMQSPEANDVLRHSAAHIMAQAVQELWPDVKVTIGPVVEEGFFYDFDSPRPFTPEDLEKIEKRMEQIVQRDLPLVREELPSPQAKELFQKMGETYKLEIIDSIGEPSVSIYKQGEWLDLCRGPHVQRTGQVKAVKVMSLAGAYWRGDETKQQLQRIYGIAFTDKKHLGEYLVQLEEAKKRDHRKLGKELGLFYFHPLSPGAPFFTGKGATIYNQLQTFIRDMYREYDFQEVISPQIFDLELFHRSGHFANYRENMYFTKIDERDFGVKPMNCPGHCLLFGAEKHSYRELPIRMADFGRLHRYERSGVMHGLTRVRSFCQDDAHIFCRVDQLQVEITNFMDLLKRVYSTLGMDEFKIFLSTRPEKRVGADEVWDKAEAALTNSLEALKLEYAVNPGDGAFYGPKLDIMFVDAIKRPWQLGTLQLDFNMPELFELKYTGEDNKDHRPVMLHRAILGSLERFIGVYLEHCAGHLPTWLAPVQVQILNVTDRQLEYCRELAQTLKAAGVRVHLDERGEKLGFKIREAQLAKVPYMLIIGDKEVDAKSISIRLRNGQTQSGLTQTEFVETLTQEINNRLLHSPWMQVQAATHQEISH